MGDKKKMIGLNIKLCIWDIINGEVKVDDVTKIIDNTTNFTTEQWENFIRAARRWVLWQSKPLESEALLRKLIKEGKIEQPRIKDKNHFPKIIDTHWVNDESEITWNK